MPGAVDFFFVFFAAFPPSLENQANWLAVMRDGFPRSASDGLRGEVFGVGFLLPGRTMSRRLPPNLSAALRLGELPRAMVTIFFEFALE